MTERVETEKPKQRHLKLIENKPDRPWDPGPDYRLRWFPALKRRDGKRGKAGYVLERVHKKGREPQ